MFAKRKHFQKDEYALQVQRFSVFFFLILNHESEKLILKETVLENDTISDFPSLGHSFLLNRQHPAFRPGPLCLCRSQTQYARNWTGRIRGWCGGTRWVFALEGPDSLGLWFRSSQEQSLERGLLLCSEGLWQGKFTESLHSPPSYHWGGDGRSSGAQSCKEGYSLRLLCGIRVRRNFAQHENNSHDLAVYLSFASLLFIKTWSCVSKNNKERTGISWELWGGERGGNFCVGNTPECFLEFCLRLHVH